MSEPAAETKEPKKEGGEGAGGAGAAAPKKAPKKGEEKEPKILLGRPGNSVKIGRNTAQWSSCCDRSQIVLQNFQGVVGMPNVGKSSTVCFAPIAFGRSHLT
jgi:hypothetical protein